MKGHVARKRFGQNFLIDQGIIRGIVSAISPRAGDTVVEIGPGLGALTKPLMQQIQPLHVVKLSRPDRPSKQQHTRTTGDPRRRCFAFDFGATGHAG
jgi:16S rRNA (adenine1518-N6/adenine1519-N6)-dimethyltransferase